MEDARKNGVCKHGGDGGRGDRRRGGLEAAGSIPGARGSGSRASRPRADDAKPGHDRRNAPRLRSSPERHPVVPVADGAFPVRAGARAGATKPRRETDVVRRRERPEGVRTAELAAADMVSRVNAPSARGRCGDPRRGEQDRLSHLGDVRRRLCRIAF